MTHYSLQALLKIREQNKKAAEQQLQGAIQDHRAEEKKLSQIEMRLRDAIFVRTTRQNNFFHKSSRFSSTKTEVICHIAANQKIMCDEIDLKRNLAEQEQRVRTASNKVELAKNEAVDARRNLQVIEKHFIAWQRRVQRAEEIREEYANDDQNSLRFLLKKV